MKNDSIFNNIRVPIVDTLYRSPFDGLQKHSEKIKECVKNLRLCLNAYLKCDFKKANRYARKVSEVEHEADMIKSNIRAHLPKFLFMSVSRADFHALLHHSDAILDDAEDVAVLLTMKSTCVPDEVNEGLHELMDKVLECVGTYQEVMSRMGVLIEVSFGGKERDRVKELIKVIHQQEHEADVIEHRISKHLFNIDLEIMDPLQVIHMLKVLNRLGGMADKAENAGEKVRELLAR